MNHFGTSLIKSIIRIVAGIQLWKMDFATAGLLFIIAELFGILEEFVDKRKEHVDTTVDTISS